MASKTRSRALSRIRYRQSKLKPEDRITIARGSNTKDLKRIEKTLNAKISISKSGLDIGQIKVLDTKTARQIEEAGRLLAIENKGEFVNKQLAKVLNKISRKAVDSTDLKPLSGFGNMEFINFTLENKINASSKLIKYDAQTIINAVSNPDFVPDTVKYLTRQVNGALQLQGLQTVVFDEFDIPDTVSRLNAVDQRTKNIAKYVEFDEDLEIEEIYD